MNASTDGSIDFITEQNVAMRVSSSFGCIFLFLYVGHIIREHIAILRRVMIPAALLAAAKSLEPFG